MLFRSILWDVHPHGVSSFTLVEDDGVTPAWRDGRVATTHATCVAAPESITFIIHPRQGDYDGMPTERLFEIQVHVPHAPAAATVNDAPAEVAFDAAFDKSNQ